MWPSLHHHKYRQMRKGKRKSYSLGKGIVLALRAHLVKLQNGRCCYCRRHLQNIGYARPVEHILPISDFPQFSVYYLNMAVACHDCNHEKADDNWGPHNPSITRYPTSTTLNHFHPRFHNYDDHIQYLRIETNGTCVSVYVGRTPQGKRLCKELLAHISQMEALYTNNCLIHENMKKLHTYMASKGADDAPMLHQFVSSLYSSIQDGAGR